MRSNCLGLIAQQTTTNERVRSRGGEFPFVREPDKQWLLEAIETLIEALHP